MHSEFSDSSQYCVHLIMHTHFSDSSRYCVLLIMVTNFHSDNIFSCFFFQPVRNVCIILLLFPSAFFPALIQNRIGLFLPHCSVWSASEKNLRVPPHNRISLSFSAALKRLIYFQKINFLLYRRIESAILFRIEATDLFQILYLLYRRMTSDI